MHVFAAKGLEELQNIIDTVAKETDQLAIEAKARLLKNEGYEIKYLKQPQLGNPVNKGIPEATEFAIEWVGTNENIIVFWASETLAKGVNYFGPVIESVHKNRWRLTVDYRFNFEEVLEYLRRLEKAYDPTTYLETPKQEIRFNITYSSKDARIIFFSTSEDVEENLNRFGILSRGDSISYMLTVSHLYDYDDVLDYIRRLEELYNGP